MIARAAAADDTNRSPGSGGQKVCGPVCAGPIRSQPNHGRRPVDSGQVRREYRSAARASQERVHPMSQIMTNVNSLIAQRVLNTNNRGLSSTMEKLATGLRINRGADDPAGLIASEKLGSQQAKIGAAMRNLERADSIVNIAEGGLQEVSRLLNDLQGLVTETANDAGLTQEEKAANQLQIDNILATVDRIAGNTSFQGTKLLNGTFGFQATVTDSSVRDYAINAAKFDGDDLDVKAIITQSAHRGGLFLSAGGATLDLNEVADAAFSFVVAGKEGNKEFYFSSGAALTDIATAINGYTDVTGVSAAVSGTGIALNSTSFGSDSFVGLQVTGGGAAMDAGDGGGIYKLDEDNNAAADATAQTDFADAGSEVRHIGQDVAGTINGQAASGRGTTLNVSSDQLDVRLTLDGSGAQTLGTIDALKITGGGAKFSLGPEVDINSQVRLGISNVSTRSLGTTDVDGTFYRLQDLGSGRHANAVNGNLQDAQRIVDNAIDHVSGLRARLGSFQSLTVQSTLNSLGVAMENTSAAQSAIRDTDFAKEAAAMTRQQILAQAATNTLALANSQPQNALALLG